MDTLWTGTEMIVWAGFTFQSTYYGIYWPTILGGRYDPATDTWRGIPDEGMPPGRRGYYRGVWTGTEAIYWGGLRDVSYDASGTLEQEFRLLGDGGRYRP